ncbi:MAG: hypothetical protein QUS12_07935 [Methanosarcina sp.]|nr:hypothetical protein [Methanosarcina sp.]
MNLGKINVSSLMGGNKTPFKRDTLILDRTLKREIENFVNTYYPDLSEAFVLEAAEAFVNKYAGYKKDYGANFIKEAMLQIFF